MFKKPFSFEGRIRRKEYLLGFIIIPVILFLVMMLFMLVIMIIGVDNVFGKMSSRHPAMSILGLVLVFVYFFLLWFHLAQNTKRCHDLGDSGWWQLIPFYFFWMLFADSQKGVNEYGKNPKGIGNEEEEEKETRG